MSHSVSYFLVKFNFTHFIISYGNKYTIHWKKEVCQLVKVHNCFLLLLSLNLSQSERNLCVMTVSSPQVEFICPNLFFLLI